MTCVRVLWVSRLCNNAQVGENGVPAGGILLFASSSETEGTMMTSSPGFQLTGVATGCCAVSCMESMTRRTSSKFRPVVMG